MVTNDQIHKQMEREAYIMAEYRRAVPIVKMVGNMLAHAIGEASKEDSAEMGFLEHENIVKAWNNGLSWYINHEGGQWLDAIWCQYLKTLKAAEYGGATIEAAFEDYGI